jgi:transcriptional regulator with XRE-family HTH domain
MSTDPSEATSPGSRLRWARLRAGFETATEFADRAHLSAVTYRAYENDQNEFNHRAAEFARILDVRTEWLLTGDGSPERAPEALVVPPLSTRVLRSVVRRVAAALGAPVEEDDPRVQKLALQLQAFSAAAAHPAFRASEAAALAYLENVLPAVHLESESAAS